MKKLTVILVICLCLALAAGFASGTAVVQGSGASAVAAKGGNGGGGGSTGGKVDPTAATLQFRDFRGDQIQSDGLGSYAGQVQQNYPDQEILLNSYSKVGRGLTRYLSFGELDAEPTNECPLTGQTNAGFKDTPTLAIIHGGDAPVGQYVARRAVLYTSVGQFNFGYRNLSTHNPGVNCSFEVIVYRDSPTTWHVTTDAASGQTLADTTLDPSWGLDPQHVPVGNRPQLQNSAGYFIGNYQMSFGMTVYCPLCK